MPQTGNLFPARLRESHQDKRQNTNFRRNGKLQACEPCRKGKMRCDHMMPICGRCAKRSKPDQCVYHPAPLTKAPNPHDTNSDQSSPRVNSFGTAYHSPSDRECVRDAVYPDAKRVKRADTFQPVIGLSRQAQSPQDQVGLEDLSRSLADRNVRKEAFGFDDSAGFINHSAVLAEHELSIGIEPPHTNIASTPKVSQSQIDRGAAVLTLLRDLPSIEKYIDKYVIFSSSYSPPPTLQSKD
jgi:hypothetical protein